MSCALSSRFEYIFVLFISLIEKAFGFLLLFALARVLSQEELGWFTAIRSIYSIFLPLTGLGLGFAYLYFSAKDIGSEQDNYKFIIYRGFWLSLVVAFLMVVVGGVVISSEVHSIVIMAVFSLQLVVMFHCEVMRSRDRIFQRNVRYALNGLLVAAIGLLSTVTGAFLFQLNGAVIFGSIGAVIALLVLWRIKKVEESSGSSSGLSRQMFWRYGLGVGFGSFMNQLLLGADVVILGYLDVPLAQIAIYKVGTLIPMQLLIVPNSFFAWKFVSLVKVAGSKSGLYDSLVSYYKWAIPFSLIFVSVLGHYSESTLIILFGDNYGAAAAIQKVFLVSFFLGCLLRAPFGTLMNAMGHSHINAILVYVMTPFCFIANYWAIKSWGIIGAAYAMAGFFAFSGIASLILFLKFSRAQTG
jgi:O-antigen/teichoic acid export membrane protein